MVRARWKRAASEGSLLPTVEGSLGTKQIRKGGKGRGWNERAGTGGGLGSERLSRGGPGGIRRRDLEGGGGRALGHMGKSNVAGTTDGSRI